MKKIKIILSSLIVLGLTSCSDDDNNTTVEEPQLIIKFQFDPNQERLNNIGESSPVPVGNAAQTPDFRKISAHYFELAPNAYTQLGEGAVLYHAPETEIGGSTAIDFSRAIIVQENETFLSIPLSQIPSGTYQYVRVSLSYQNYGINITHDGATYTGIIDSFVGYNTYIATHSIGNNSFPVNANRLQGYWAFALDDYPYATSGQSTATTVPNPLASTSPIPSGSCVVTGGFTQNLIIDGNETNDIEVTLSLSINKSFEWEEINTDGNYEPSIGETVVDMGLRGLLPSFVKK